jgi:glycosidase
MARLTSPRADPPRHRAWWQGGVVHEIYPRSFADADGDGVGDLRGVVAHLDYLASGSDGLGVDAIWLTPFYPSGGVDGGHDVADYCQDDPAKAKSSASPTRRSRPPRSSTSTDATPSARRCHGKAPLNAGPGAGFTTGQPWLPIPPGAEHASVAAQHQDRDSMLSLHRRLIAPRKRHPDLTCGSYRPERAPDDVFAYRRTDPDGDLLIALNFAAQERPLPDAFRGVLLLSSDRQRTEHAASSELRLAPHEGLVLAAP